MVSNYAPWVLFNLFVLAVLAVDLGILNKTSHVISRREALAWSSFWIGLALAFCLGIYYFESKTLALEFLAGYVIEKSLSVDNLFVIMLIFKMYHITPRYQHRVLFWGILGALVFRAIMILAGLKLIETFDWMLYVFGLFLIYAGISTMMDKLPPGEEAPENPFIRWVNSKLPMRKDEHDHRFFFWENGKFYVTPLFTALIFIEFADLMFAVDSIPAVIAISRDPFIIYTSNIFAILGLRSLYFLIADVVPKFHYIHHALSIILIFVGIKLLATDFYHIPIAFSLSFILGVFAVGIIASILRRRWEKA